MLPPRISRHRLFWILQLGGWAAFFGAMLVAGVSHWPPAFAAIHKTSLTLFGFLASLLLRWIYTTLRLRIRRLSLPGLFVLSFPLSFGAAGLWMASHNLMIAAYQRGLQTGLRNAPDFINTIYYAFVLVAWSVLYFAIPSWLDLIEERERVLKIELLAREARLQALRLQIQPHFLFNTLNAISTLVSESRNADANRMISRLADFLRLTLERADTTSVPLSDEIEFARNYLEIEQARFGDRLRVEISIAPGLDAVRVPSLLLQPLIENAVRHAIVPRESGGTLRVIARAENGQLVLEVHDDGPGLGDSPGRGVGLRNTRQRLQESYGSSAALTFGSSPLGGLLVSVSIPLSGSEVEES